MQPSYPTASTLQTLVFMLVVCRMCKSQHFPSMGSHPQYSNPTTKTIDGLQPCNPVTQQRPLYRHLYLCSLYAGNVNPNISHQWPLTPNTHIQPKRPLVVQYSLKTTFINDHLTVLVLKREFSKRQKSTRQ